MTDNATDIDPVESQEWQDAIEDVIQRDGRQPRALPAG